MQISDFFWKVEEDPQLRGVDLQVGDGPQNDAIIVEDLQSGFKTKFNIKTVLENEWNLLRALAIGEEDIAPLYHVTRIVGYYSRIENWNKSKIGELADRRRGNYSLAS